jgi:acyl phosphate:glycerol-3-phosphate acyltransferase
MIWYKCYIYQTIKNYYLSKDKLMTDLFLIIFAYLLGSLSMAIIACKLAGLPDPRTRGSGNPGATNVLRLGSKRLAASVLLGDMLKGLVPVLLAKYLGVSSLTLAATGIAVFLGHCYPIFFSFRGGKGVATALGIMFGLSWLIGTILISAWILLVVIFHFSSLAAISAALLAPLITMLVLPTPELIAMVCVISALLVWRHRKNIHNLCRGIEPRIGKP